MQALWFAGMSRLLIFELRRQFDHCLANHYRDGIEIRPLGGKTQTKSLQRDRTTAREWVVNRWQAIGEILANLSTSTTKNFISCGVFPLHQILNNPKETLTFFLDRLVCRELLWVTRRIINELSEQHRSARRQWTSRPPQMQRGRMPMADRLLASRSLVNRFEGDCDLDELFLGVIRRGHKRACRLRGGWSARRRRATRAGGRPSSRRHHPRG